MDPIDVLVLMDEPAFPGCALTCRPIGVIEGEQELPRTFRQTIPDSRCEGTQSGSKNWLRPGCGDAAAAVASAEF
jgi:hypothetical protein